MSTCDIQGAPVCVCDPIFYSRLLDNKCTAAPLKRWGYLDIQNAARAAVGSVPLQWDDNLAGMAQDWADRLATSTTAPQCSAARQKLSGIAQLVVNHPGDITFSTSNAVRQWVQQGSRYRYARFAANGPGGCRTGKAADCAAYTQVIWNNTRKIGCGLARCTASQTKVWVCNYSPAGNVVGEFPYIKRS